MRQRCHLQGVQHQHVRHGAEDADDQGVAPLLQPQRPHGRTVAQQSGCQKNQAQQVAKILHQNGRHQRHLDGIAIDHGVTGDEQARDAAIKNAGAHTHLLERVLRGLPKPRAARDQKHATHHAQNADQAQRRNLLTQEENRYHGRQQRPRAPRQRVNHRQVCLAVAAQQHDEINNVQQGAGQHQAPLLQTPGCHLRPTHPQAHRCPKHHQHHRSEGDKAHVATGFFGRNVPTGMDETRQNDQGKRTQGHGREKAPCGAWGEGDLSAPDDGRGGHEFFEQGQ